MLNSGKRLYFHFSVSPAFISKYMHHIRFLHNGIHNFYVFCSSYNTLNLNRTACWYVTTEYWTKNTSQVHLF